MLLAPSSNALMSHSECSLKLWEQGIEDSGLLGGNCWRERLCLNWELLLCWGVEESWVYVPGTPDFEGLSAKSS